MKKILQTQYLQDFLCAFYLSVQFIIAYKAVKAFSLLFGGSNIIRGVSHCKDIYRHKFIGQGKFRLYHIGLEIA